MDISKLDDIRTVIKNEVYYTIYCFPESGYGKEYKTAYKYENNEIVIRCEDIIEKDILNNVCIEISSPIMTLKKEGEINEN